MFYQQLNCIFHTRHLNRSIQKSIITETTYMSEKKTIIVSVSFSANLKRSDLNLFITISVVWEYLIARCKKQSQTRISEGLFVTFSSSTKFHFANYFYLQNDNRERLRKTKKITSNKPEITNWHCNFGSKTIWKVFLQLQQRQVYLKL